MEITEWFSARILDETGDLTKKSIETAIRLFKEYGDILFDQETMDNTNINEIMEKINWNDDRFMKFWDTIRPRFEALSGEAKEFILTTTEGSYKSQLEYCLRTGDWKYREFFKEIGISFRLLKMVSEFPERTGIHTIRKAYDRTKLGEDDSYIETIPEYSLAAKIWANPEISDRIPEYLRDLCVFVDYGDNDFSLDMMGAGEKLADMITGEIQRCYEKLEDFERYPEYQERYNEENKKTAERVRALLEPTRLVEVIKALFASEYIAGRADYVKDSGLNGIEDSVKLIERATELKEYLLGEPRKTDLWSSGTLETMIRVGTIDEVRSWMVGRFGNETEDSFEKLWGNSEWLLIEVKDGLDKVYTK